MANKVVSTLVRLVTDSLLNCTDGPLGVPSSKEFLTHLTPGYVITIIVCTCICLATLCLGVIHVLYVQVYVTHYYRKAFVLYLAGTAPFVSAFALVSMYMPRVWFLAHLLSFFYFSIGLYCVICLMMHIVDGRVSMVKKITQQSSKMHVRTPPFCCVFPCLPALQVETKKIKFLECMVLQTPIVRLFATIVSLVLYFEYQDSAIIALKILDFISLPSLLLGIYGCHILVTTVSKLDELMPYRYIVVFRLLDIYFMFFGLQQPVFDFAARAGLFGCGEILPPLETAFFWKNGLSIIESFIISIIATLLLKPSRSAIFDKYPGSGSGTTSISPSSCSTSVTSSLDTNETST